MPDFNIRIGKMGSVNANNNKGVVNILAVSQDIKNSISELPSASGKNQVNAKEVFEQLRLEITNSSELSSKKKEKALKQVGNLASLFKDNSQTGLSKQELADNAITLIKGTITGVSGVASILKLLPEVASLFGVE